MFCASYLDFHCLPLSNKKDARLIWVRKSVVEDYAEQKWIQFFTESVVC